MSKFPIDFFKNIVKKRLTEKQAEYFDKEITDPDNTIPDPSGGRTETDDSTVEDSLP
tara:strand:+ start:1566 stop:1736 length:171 start_codon:yes stop_codon:yes gene_type:complete